jgi:hypothetical protein
MEESGHDLSQDFSGAAFPKLVGREKFLKS